MEFPLLAILGAVLIILEIYLPKSARRLERSVITFPRRILHYVFGLKADFNEEYDDDEFEWDYLDFEDAEMDEKIGCLFVIVGILSMAYFVAFFFFDMMLKYPLLMEILGYAIAFPIAFYFWTYIANIIFLVFNFITMKKPFAGIGLLIAIIDIVS